MKGYFFTLLVTSVCGAVCSILANGGFERYIKYIASLVCLVIMILPFREMDISEITETVKEETEVSQTEFDSELYQTAAQLTEKSAEEYISQIVFNRFGINPIYTHIQINWSEEDAVIENISVALSSSDFEKAEEVKNYLVSALGGEVNVVEG